MSHEASSSASGTMPSVCFELCHRRTIAAMRAQQCKNVQAGSATFALWSVNRCSYNRSLAGRSGSRPRNNSMNRSRNNRGWLASLVNVNSRPGYRRRYLLSQHKELQMRLSSVLSIVVMTAAITVMANTGSAAETEKVELTFEWRSRPTLTMRGDYCPSQCCDDD